MLRRAGQLDIGSCAWRRTFSMQPNRELGTAVSIGLQSAPVGFEATVKSQRDVTSDNPQQPRIPIVGAYMYTGARS